MALNSILLVNAIKRLLYFANLRADGFGVITLASYFLWTCSYIFFCFLLLWKDFPVSISLPYVHILVRSWVWPKTGPNLQCWEYTGQCGEKFINIWWLRWQWDGCCPLTFLSWQDSLWTCSTWKKADDSFNNSVITDFGYDQKVLQWKIIGSFLIIFLFIVQGTLCTMCKVSCNKRCHFKGQT